MRKVLLTAALLTKMAVSAQQAATPKSEQPINLHLAGQHLEIAGKQRTAGLFIGLGLGAVAAMVASMDSDNIAPAIGLGVCGMGISIGFNLGANGNERKAGRILQAR